LTGVFQNEDPTGTGAASRAAVSSMFGMYPGWPDFMMPKEMPKLGDISVSQIFNYNEPVNTSSSSSPNMTIPNFGVGRGGFLNIDLSPIPSTNGNLLKPLPTVKPGTAANSSAAGLLPNNDSANNNNTRAPVGGGGGGFVPTQFNPVKS
jgi:hypothetical protein